MSISHLRIELRRLLYNLDNMDDFKLFLASAIKKEKDSIIKRYAKDTRGMTEEQKAEYFDIYGEDYAKVEDSFESISWNSFVVILFSIIEMGMNELCQAAKHDKNLNLDYKDVANRGIVRAKIYLEKVANVNLNTSGTSWQEISCLIKIRNAIVHNDGWVNDKLSKDARFLQHLRNGTLELDKKVFALPTNGHAISGKIIIGPAYIEHILQSSRDYFKEIVL